MQPLINPGQFVLVSSLFYLFRNPKEEDVVVFKSDKKFIIKRIKAIKNNKFFIEGDNRDDSKSFGDIERSEILGKVVAIW